MKVVTGRAGFIGSHLARALAKEDDVIIFDNLSAGERNLKDMPGNVKLIRGDIRDLDSLKAAFKGADCIFHLAAQISVQRSTGFPQETEEINIKETLNVLEAARFCKVKKVIFSSSSTVYGNLPDSLKKEGMPPAPLSPYAISKLSGECFCKMYNDIYSIKTISLRYFNIFGLRQDSDSEYSAVIPKFIKPLSNNEQSVIFGDSTQSRDFIFVKEVVHVNILARKVDINGEVVNIASDQSTDLLKLVDMINELMGKSLKSVFESPKEGGGIKHSLADIAVAARLLSFIPETSFYDGLKKTISWFTD